MKVELPIASFSNQALLEETMRLATDARCTTAKLITALAEVDARKLWADEGCSSLCTYCTQVLRFSEHESYLRMEAARVGSLLQNVHAVMDPRNTARGTSARRCGGRYGVATVAGARSLGRTGGALKPPSSNSTI